VSKVFVKSLLLAVLTVVILTACGTAAATPPGSTPAYPSSDKQTPAYPNSASSSTVSFATDILPIFESRCVSCHGGEKTQKGLDLTSYASAIKGSTRGPVIVASDSGNSLLFMNVASGKMPKSGPKLTPQEISLIMKWINEGALNN
jgi:uncharacterized membrane protein